MITFSQVSKAYTLDSPALANVNIKIPTGDFVSIVGQSGAGKSTLLKLLSAEERPSAGKIVIDGWDITQIKKWQIPHLRRQIGVVFQDFKLLPKRSAFENVAFAMEVGGAMPREIRETVPHILKLVNLLEKSDVYPTEMSGGEKQRVGIARALIKSPDILVFDEATSNLDASLRRSATTRSHCACVSLQTPNFIGRRADGQFRRPPLMGYCAIAD